MAASDLRPRTIFFGGGTPSLLNLRQWEQVLNAMQRLGLLCPDEWTVECNPATVSLDKARLLRSYGVNRISMGVQSLDEALLDRLGRVHSREMVFKSFDTLRKAGFDNINLDLMFAIPGQTLEIWRDTLGEALALGSEHLSSYEVIYEEDTALYAQLRARQFDIDEDLACAMYEELVEHATAAGLRQYEVANFCRDATLTTAVGEPPRIGNAAEAVQEPGERVMDCRRPVPLSVHRADAALKPDPSAHPPRYACKHNVNYWRGGSFYGLGPSATSYVRGVRTRNWSNTKLYCEQVEQGRRAIESSEELPPIGRAGETAAFGLRMTEGWPFESFQRATGFDLRADWSAEMEQLKQRGWAISDREGFRLTQHGLRFADAAAEMFLR
jgi:oxygen-independent coproporphyrinogen-3 oxidase